MNLSIRSRPAVRGVLVMTGTALLLTALAGCSKDKETVADWAKDGGHKHMSAIATDVKTLGEVSGQFAADIAPRCSQVLDDVKAAKAFRDPPDKLANDWQEALNQVQTAASHCLRNVKAGRGADLVEAIDALTSFRAFLSGFDLALSQS
ncbi:hypothetical protein ACIRP7_19585 [Streptomyces sp. NPDC102270]|uniref:hypothetical protein n=1 Tax=Streptomyces sp. NPDC102270 TaxID=3366150 RepID=UPI0038073CCB